VSQAIGQAVAESTPRFEKTLPEQQAEVRIVLMERTCYRGMLHAFQPSERPGGEALDTRSMIANTGTQRIQRLTKPRIIGLGYQALDQSDSLSKACDFARRSKAVEH
jgi:hypothetical protein